MKCKKVRNSEALQYNFINICLLSQFLSIFRIKFMKYFTIIFISIVLRVSLILMAAHFEDPQHLSLTDIDYKIYSEAAQYVTSGGSPYDRHTYRYSPLLSYLMIVNQYFGFAAGKFVLVIFDVIALILIKKVCKDSELPLKLYGFNPLFIYLTARGSIQSINSVFFLLTYLLLKDKKTNFIAGVVYGLWVHFRVYPVIFGISILIYISEKFKIMKNIYKFLFGAGISFLAVSALFYLLYGQSFLSETYFYHFTRIDNRHNLSVYFYNIYLRLAESQNFIHSVLPTLMTLYLFKEVISRYSHNLRFSMFLLSYIFVLFNKVLTVQYYMWAHVPILLILPYSKWFESKFWRAGLHSYAVWVLGVLVWVWTSFQIESHGRNIFKMMWISCMFRFAGETWILLTMFKYFKFDMINADSFGKQIEQSNNHLVEKKKA